VKGIGVAHKLKGPGNGYDLFFAFIGALVKFNQTGLEVLEIVYQVALAVYDLAPCIGPLLPGFTHDVNILIIQTGKYKLPEFAREAGA